MYNKQQVRYRLNHAELYIANTKPSGFCIEVGNLLHPTHVMVGVRVHIGTKSLEKVPSFIEVFGRTKTVFLSGGKVIQICMHNFTMYIQLPVSILKYFLCEVLFGIAIDTAGSPRWIDIPFTREESLQADKTFKLNCKCACLLQYSSD